MKNDDIVVGFLKTCLNRLDVLEARVNALEATVNTLSSLHERKRKEYELSDEQRKILQAEGITIRDKAEKLGKSKSWVSKWVNRLR
jgi:cysteinyl-tRNA synthetase